MKSLNQLSNESLSVCDGCSHWHICKFSEDVKRAEAEYKQIRENVNLPECVETTMRCKYKQYMVSRLISYNDADSTTMYSPSNAIDYPPTKTT